MVSEVMVSQAVLICNPQSLHQDLIALILKRIEGYITAQHYMMISYNVTRANLSQALAVRCVCGGVRRLGSNAHPFETTLHRRSHRGSGRRQSARWRKKTGWRCRH